MSETEQAAELSVKEQNRKIALREMPSLLLQLAGLFGLVAGMIFFIWQVFAPWPNNKWTVHPVQLPSSLVDAGLSPKQLTSRALALSEEVIQASKSGLLTETRDAIVPTFDGAPMIVCGFRPLGDPSTLILQALNELPSSLSGENVEFFFSDQTQPMMEQLRGVRRLLGFPVYSISPWIEQTSGRYRLHVSATTPTGDQKVVRALPDISSEAIEKELAAAVTQITADPVFIWTSAAIKSAHFDVSSRFQAFTYDTQSAEHFGKSREMKLLKVLSQMANTHLYKDPSSIMLSTSPFVLALPLKSVYELDPSDQDVATYLEIALNSLNVDERHEVSKLLIDDLLDEESLREQLAGVQRSARHRALISFAAEFSQHQTADCLQSFDCIRNKWLELARQEPAVAKELSGLWGVHLAVMVETEEQYDAWSETVAQVMELCECDITDDWMLAEALILSSLSDTVTSRDEFFPSLLTLYLLEQRFRLSDSQSWGFQETCFREALANATIARMLSEVAKGAVGSSFETEAFLMLLFANGIDQRKDLYVRLQVYEELLTSDDDLSLTNAYLGENRDMTGHQSYLLSNAMMILNFRNRPGLANELFEEHAHLQSEMAQRHSLQSAILLDSLAVGGESSAARDEVR